MAHWLVDIAGFDRSLITTRGYGETRPAYPNDSAAHRQLNRRVVITVASLIATTSLIPLRSTPART